MNQLPFTFSNALMHLFRTEGPKGFIWKFGLAYGVAGTLLYALMFWAFAPIFSTVLSPDLMNDPDAVNAAILGNMTRILLGYVTVLVGALFLWILFEAASQRRYIRAEGFSLRFGADEGRLFVVGLFFVGIFFATYIALIVAIGLVMGVAAVAGGEQGAGIGALLVFPLMLAYFVGIMILMVRLSPAASLTVRDRKTRFSSAWRVSKGKAWTIFGSWLLIYIIMYAVMIVIYLIFIAIAFTSVVPALMEAEANGGDPAQALAGLLSPATLAAAILGSFVLCSAMGVALHAFGGPAALATKNDPEWVDQASIGQTFG